MEAKELQNSSKRKVWSLILRVKRMSVSWTGSRFLRRGLKVLAAVFRSCGLRDAARGEQAAHVTACGWEGDKGFYHLQPSFFLLITVNKHCKIRGPFLCRSVTVRSTFLFFNPQNRQIVLLACHFSYRVEQFEMLCVWMTHGKLVKKHQSSQTCRIQTRELVSSAERSGSVRSNVRVQSGWSHVDQWTRKNSWKGNTWKSVGVGSDIKNSILVIQLRFCVTWKNRMKWSAKHLLPKTKNQMLNWEMRLIFEEEKLILNWMPCCILLTRFDC